MGRTQDPSPHAKGDSLGPIPKVLPDWTPFVHSCADKGEQKRDCKANSVTGLRSMLRDAKNEGELRELQDASKKNIKADKTKRKANRAFIERVDNALRKGVGFDLAMFRVPHPVAFLAKGQKRVFLDTRGDEFDDSRPRKRAHIESPGERCEVEFPQEFADGRLSRPTLHLCSDLGATGFSAAWWLLHGYKVRGSFNWDLPHRLHCAAMSATAESGLSVLRLEFLQVVKLRQGPFKPGGAHHGVLVEAAKEMRDSLDEHNPLFFALYDGICKDMGRDGPDKNTDEHVRETWRLCMDSLCLAGKGSNARDGRWWSFETLSRAFLPQMSATLMLLCWVGFRRQWWSLDACPLFRSGGILAQDSLGELAGEATSAGGSEDKGEREGCEEDEGEDNGGPIGDGPSSSRVSVATARAEVRKRRAQCVASLQYTALMLSKSMSVRLWRCLIWAPRSLQRWFNDLLVRLKTRAGAKAVHVELAGGSLATEGLNLLAGLFEHDMPGLLELQADASATQFQMKRDAVVCACLWKYTVHLAGLVAETSMQYVMPPLSFVALADPATRAAALARLKTTWEALVRLEAQAAVDKECKQWLASVCWPLQHWAREILCFLAEDDFDRVSALVLDEVTMYSDSFWTTLSVENVFNAGRDLSSKARKGSLSLCSLWHHTTFGCSVLPDFDLAPVRISEAGRAASAGSVPASTFKCQAGEGSLPDEALNHLCAEHPDWPNVTPSGMSENGLKWQLALAAEGEFHRMQKAWHSCLAQPGWAVIRDDRRESHIVLRSGRHGMLLARAPMVKEAGAAFVIITDDTFKKGVVFDFVEDPARWKVAVLELAPVSSLPPAVAAKGQLKLKIVASGSLLAVAAKYGLKGVSAHFLKKLLDEQRLEFTGRAKPRSELTILEALVRHFVPKCSDDALREALKERDHDMSADLRENSPLFSKEFEGLLATTEDEDDDIGMAEIHREYAKHRDAISQKEKRDTYRQTLLQEIISKQESARSHNPSSGSGGGGRPAPMRKFNPKPGSGYSRSEALKLAPPKCSLWKDEKENRWRCKAEYMPSGKSKSWGGGTSLDDFNAMKYVLRAAWEAYADATGEPIAVDFETAPPAPV